MPYGQRKYRDSGRGKVLNKTRHCSPEPAGKLNIFRNNQCNKVSRSNRDRIKPPPDILSGHMKRIKIDSLICDVNNSKRKMSIDSVSASVTATLFLVLIVFDFNDHCVLTVTQCGIQRPIIISKITCFQDASTKDSPPIKKEKKLITWP